MPKAQASSYYYGRKLENLTIPLWIHGDGVEFQDRDSLMVWTMGSLLSLQPALDSSLLMAANAKSRTVEESSTCPGTWKEPWRHLVHAFLNLASGTFADVDADGFPEALAGESIATATAGVVYRFIIWVIEGDHEFFSNALKLPHWACHCMCWTRDADTSNPEKHGSAYQIQDGNC